MRSLFRYLLKNYAFVLFVSLEIIAMVMIFNNNKYHKAKYLNSANYITGSVYNSFNSVISYFQLNEANKKLAEENAHLKTLLYTDSVLVNSSDTIWEISENMDSSFRFIASQVINNSINNPHNYITLNKGQKHGIRADQGIIAQNGIVGVVIDVSKSYSVGLSVLNRRWSVSAKLKNTDYFGSLYWGGSNYRTASLMEIPFHVDVEQGDSVVTSGYSSVFPEGIMIGTIKSFDKAEGENYYNIEVNLSTDFKSLSHVQVIENVNREEIKSLESLNGNNELSN